MIKRLIINLFAIAVVISLLGCNNSKDVTAPTSTIMSSFTTPKPYPGEVAFVQWEPRYRYFDALWLASSDGSHKELAFDWLGFTHRYTFSSDGSGIYVWMQEAPKLENYIYADLGTRSPGDCITCEINGYDSPPFPSPTGDKLIVTAQSGLYLVNQDGTGKTLVVDNEGGHFWWNPSWSPDGKSIAFTMAPPQGGVSIYRIDRDGRNFQNLTLPLGADQQSFACKWSPVGNHIAFVSGDGYIRTVHADGTGMQIVSKIQVDTEIWDVQNQTPPQWSPDGRKLLFSTVLETGNKSDIVVINEDGTGLINLTNTPNSSDTKPIWSPDGKKIAFRTNRDGNWEIYVMNADGSNPVNISQTPDRSEDEPAWRP